MGIERVNSSPTGIDGSRVDGSLIDGKITTTQELHDLRNELWDLFSSGEINFNTYLRMISEINRGRLSPKMCALLYKKTKNEALRKEIAKAGRNGLVINQGAQATRTRQTPGTRQAPRTGQATAENVLKFLNWSIEESGLLNLPPRPVASVPPSSKYELEWLQGPIPMPKGRPAESLVPPSKPEERVAGLGRVTDPPILNFSEGAPPIDIPTPPIRHRIASNPTLDNRLKIIAAKHLPRGCCVTDVEGEYRYDENGNPREIRITAIKYMLPDGRVITETTPDRLAVIQNKANGRGG